LDDREAEGWEDVEEDNLEGNDAGEGEDIEGSEADFTGM
jgi:hypothetical protein